MGTDLRWQQVVCGDCGRAYQCTPMDDYYLPTGSTDGVRVCYSCLLRRVPPPPPCPRCGHPCHKVPTPAHPGDDAWVWGHDCSPYYEGP